MLAGSVVIPTEIRWAFFSRFDPIRSTVDRPRAFTPERRKKTPSRHVVPDVRTKPTTRRGRPVVVRRPRAVLPSTIIIASPASFVRSNCSNNEKRARSRTGNPRVPTLRLSEHDRSTDRPPISRAGTRAWDRRTHPPPTQSPIRRVAIRKSKRNHLDPRSIDRSIARTSCASPTKLHMSDCSYRKNGRVLSFNSSMG